MLPLLITVQEMCARIGLVTGQGIAAVVRKHYSRRVLFAAVSLVLIANTLNVGADLGAMAATVQLLVPGAPFFALITLLSFGVLALEIFVPYRRYAVVLKALTLSLLAYVATGFIIFTTGSVLYTHGITNITTADQAVAALEPLVHSFPQAGLLAKALFAIGILGVGLLGVSMLAGSAAYAVGGVPLARRTCPQCATGARILWGDWSCHARWAAPQHPAHQPDNRAGLLGGHQRCGRGSPPGYHSHGR
jgi:Mn2+/Fe2+ NRAMP family transporter